MVDRKPSSLLAYMQVSGYRAVLTPIHLVFLELDTYHCHLDFEVLDENNNLIIPKIFFLQLLNNDNDYLW